MAGLTQKDGLRHAWFRKMDLPVECSIAVFLVFKVVAIVAFTIRPFEDTVPVHLVIFPHSDVLAAVAPLICTFTLDVVVHEVALINIVVAPSEPTEAFFHSFLIVAFEFWSIWPSFDTFAVLSIFLPESSIDCAILVEVVTKAISLIVYPLSLVNISIFVKKSTSAIGFAIFPVALIKGSIWPNLDSLALSHVSPF